MLSPNRIAIAIFSSLILLASCSIEKRMHMDGYHVEWRKSHKSIAKIDRQSQKEIYHNKLRAKDLKEFMKNEGPLLLASNRNDFNIEPPFSAFGFLDKNKPQSAGECETIIMRSGEEIQAKVLEVGTSEVKYKMCDNQDGPTFATLKSEIFMIKYPNGSKTVFDNTPKPTVSSSSSNISDDEYLNTINTDDKSIVVAVALWFFLGWLGIHRFYLGHIGVGVLYLLTGSLCGLGWIIDGILFLTGGLKPKKGDYMDM